MIRIGHEIKASIMVALYSTSPEEQHRGRNEDCLDRAGNQGDAWTGCTAAGEG